VNASSSCRCCRQADRANQRSSPTPDWQREPQSHEPTRDCQCLRWAKRDDG
jgi:hypothetical protein